MADKEPKQQTESGDTPNWATSKRVAKLAEKAIHIFQLNKKIGDTEEIVSDESVEHRAWVDEIPAGAIITVAATKENMLLVRKAPSNDVVGKFKGGICFTGVRAKTNLPDAVLRINQQYNPEFYTELDASNSEGEYLIKDIQLPETSE